MMHLSDNTIKVLQNFSVINDNIMIREGNVLRTVSENKALMAAASVEESFPEEFGIYELSEFLSAVSLVSSAELEFEDKYLLITDQSGRGSSKYFYADESSLTFPVKDITMPHCEVKFELDSKTFSSLKRAASVFGHNELVVTSEGNSIKCTVSDTSNPTSNEFSIQVPGSFEQPDFRFVFKIDNLKLLDGDYIVNASSVLISHFVNTSANVEYWCAIEKHSTYGV